MNERIKELANQAPLLKSYDYPDLRLVDDDQLERFAELIVRECIERVRAQYTSARDQLDRTEREQGIVECGVASVIALEELVQESTEQWYKENILGGEE